MADDNALLSALAELAQRGAIGERSLPVAVSHAEQFAVAVPPTAVTLADLGSGGGLPGLVVAVRCPWLRVCLVERRSSRADLLRRAVLALDLAERVEVFAADVRHLVEQRTGGFDVVTARSFGPPPVTARWGSALLTPGGLLIVSEPPDGDSERWPLDLLAPLGLRDLGREQGIHRFQRH
jgi:16S rRNA (guanine527-N7)-methyltransferase